MREINYWDTKQDRSQAGSAWNIMSYLLTGTNDYKIEVDKDSLVKVIDEFNKKSYVTKSNSK